MYTATLLADNNDYMFILLLSCPYYTFFAKSVFCLDIRIMNNFDCMNILFMLCWRTNGMIYITTDELKETEFIHDSRHQMNHLLTMLIFKGSV